MRTFFASILLSGFLAASCTKSIYVPVESVRTKYKNLLMRDSIFLRDSTITFLKGDTVYKEKYRYLYKDKLLRDTVSVNDTIRIPYPVTESKGTNHLSGFQHFQVWCGRILLGLLGGYIAIRLIKKRFGI